MGHHNFEELEVWKRACRLSVDVLGMIEQVKLFALRDQMARACISIASNIAEGAERESDKEFRRFLNIAKSSAAELRTQLLIGSRAKLLPESSSIQLAKETKEIAAMISGLANRLKPSD